MPSQAVPSFDARNVRTLPGIPPRELEAALAHFKDLLVSWIYEKCVADYSMHTYVTDDGESRSGDWLAAASLASKEVVKTRC